MWPTHAKILSTQAPCEHLNGPMSASSKAVQACWCTLPCMRLEACVPNLQVARRTTVALFPRVHDRATRSQHFSSRPKFNQWTRLSPNDVELRLCAAGSMLRPVPVALLTFTYTTSLSNLWRLKLNVQALITCQLNRGIFVKVEWLGL